MVSHELTDVAPFADLLGIELIESGENFTMLRLSQRKELTNRLGFIHGGVLTTLLDSAMARASRNINGVIGIAGTVDIHVQFIHPGSGVIHAKGWIEGASKKLAFARGEIRNESGNIVATSAATMRLHRS